jgi:hypothetical protein
MQGEGKYKKGRKNKGQRGQRNDPEQSSWGRGESKDRKNREILIYLIELG